MRLKQLTRQKAYTLIELVMTIVIASILVKGLSQFIFIPVKAFVDTAKRSELGDSLELALKRMGRDLNRAVPNSVRVSPQTNLAIEFTNIVEALRYRSNGPAENNAPLTLLVPQSKINTTGLLQIAPTGLHTDYRVIVYNTGNYGANSDAPVAGENIYANQSAPGPYPPIGSNVITNSSNSVTLSNGSKEALIQLSSNHLFAFPSYRQRIFISDGPVSYICDLSNKTLTRYWGYTMTAVQGINPNVAPLNAGQSALLAQNISQCSFSYQTSNGSGNGLVNINLGMGKGSDMVNLIYQVSVGNAS